MVREEVREEYLRRVESIHAALGIPPTYSIARNLTPCFEASTLTPVEGHDRRHYLAPKAAVRWREMKIAAAIDAIELRLISGFRSVDYQCEIIEKKLRQGADLNTVLSVNAAPGFSQHHTGLALDIGTPTHLTLVEDFENTEAFQWLTSHAEKFGFLMPYVRGNRYGFIYEPWHWVLKETNDL
jgi:D-alanyl-D-alanine carboxypeptidase